MHECVNRYCNLVVKTGRLATVHMVLSLCAVLYEQVISVDDVVNERLEPAAWNCFHREDKLINFCLSMDWMFDILCSLF
jgi:hypothetical protein